MEFINNIFDSIGSILMFLFFINIFSGGSDDAMERAKQQYEFDCQQREFQARRDAISRND